MQVDLAEETSDDFLDEANLVDLILVMSSVIYFDEDDLVVDELIAHAKVMTSNKHSRSRLKKHI